MLNKEEWEQFWERLLKRADEKDAWWLCGWLEAQKEEYDGKKIFIPAVCMHLKKVRNKKIYRCKIHELKFANCRLGGEKECKEAQKSWSLLHPND
jgi:hypothetical protein